MPRDVAPNIVIVDTSGESARAVAETIDAHYGSACTEVVNSVARFGELDLKSIDAALFALRIGDGELDEALRALGRRLDEIPVIALVGVEEAIQAVRRLRRGVTDFVVQIGDYARVIPFVVEKNLELARMRHENLRLQSALASSLAELKRKNKELEQAAARFERMASTDLLTNLANRRRLELRLEAMFAEAERYDQDLSCLMIDLDGFKAINDRLGHQRGDELLELAGRIINAQIRSSDLGARYGGDEFVVALPHTSSETAAVLAQRLMTEFHQREVEVLGDRMRCGMSIGVASLRVSEPKNPQQLIAHADTALYAAKMNVDDRLMVCGPDGATAVKPAA